MFKVGDRIVLVNVENMDCDMKRHLTLGKIYTVQHYISDRDVRIINDSGSVFGYYGFRFSLAPTLNYKGKYRGGSLWTE